MRDLVPHPSNEMLSNYFLSVLDIDALLRRLAIDAAAIQCVDSTVCAALVSRETDDARHFLVAKVHGESTSFHDLGELEVSAEGIDVAVGSGIGQFVAFGYEELGLIVSGHVRWNEDGDEGDFAASGGDGVDGPVLGDAFELLAVGGQIHGAEMALFAWLTKLAQ